MNIRVSERKKLVQRDECGRLGNSSCSTQLSCKPYLYFRNFLFVCFFVSCVCVCACVRACVCVCVCVCS